MKKQLFNFLVLLLGVWASPVLGLDVENRCSASFASNANAKVATLVKMSPSKAVSRGRYEVEEFIAETVGKDFLRDNSQIQVDIQVSEENLEKTVDRLAALGIVPTVAEEAFSDESTITVFADARDLINLLRELTPNSYFLSSTYDPRSSIFGLEI